MRQLLLMWFLLGVSTCSTTIIVATTPFNHSGMKEITHTSVKTGLFNKTHHHDEDNAEGLAANEERGGISSGMKTFLSKINRSFDKIKARKGILKAQDQESFKAQDKEFLIKMEKMYRTGTTPEKLAERYGSTKMQLQDEFSQYHKWRSSWKLQKPYPRPKKLDPAKNSDDTFRHAVQAHS